MRHLTRARTEHPPGQKATENGVADAGPHGGDAVFPAELAGIADTTVFIARDSAVKPILIRPHQHIDKGGLAAAVAADQRAVPPRLKAK